MVRVGKDPVYTTCYNCEEHIVTVVEKETAAIASVSCGNIDRNRDCRM